MKPSEIRVMSDEQIADKIDELREEWRQHRFDQAVGRLQNTSRIGNIRRDIARLLTIQTERVRERELAELLND
jgi:large subunit ribosomal protein L29